MLPDVVTEQGLHLLEPALSNITFELGQSREIVFGGRGLCQFLQVLSGSEITRVEIDSFFIGVGSAAFVALLLQNHSKVALRIGRIGPKLEGMPKLGGSLIQIAFVERGAALGNVQVDILVAVVSGGKLTALL